MAITAIRTYEGRTFFGQENGDLGPCNLYYPASAMPNLTGTLATTGTAVTGTGTLFQTEGLVVGDYIAADPGTGMEVRQISAITSETAMTLTAAFSSDLAGDTYSKHRAMWLARTGEVELTDSEKYSPIKFIQGGDMDADNVVTGAECTIKVQLAEMDVYRLSSLFNHIKGQRNSGTGVYEGTYRSMSLGTRHSDFWDELKLVKIVNGADSPDWDQQVTFLKAAPIFNLNAKFDPTSQRMAEVEFRVYPDYTKLVNGKPVLWYSGTVTFDTI